MLSTTFKSENLTTEEFVSQLSSIHLAATVTNKLDIEQIIKNLGGIDKVVQHCVSNSDYRNKNITQQNIQNLDKSLFHSLSNQQKNTTNTLNNNQNNHNNDNPTQQLQAQHVQSQHGQSQHVQSQHTSIDQFMTHQTIFLVNEHNNICFQYMKENYAQFIQHKIVFNKWFVCCLIFIYSLQLCLSSYFDSYNKNGCVGICNTIETVGLSIFCLYLISYFCCANISLMSIISVSFDFWFKTYNLIIFITSTIINYHVLTNESKSTSYVTATIFWITDFLAWNALFIIDAVNVSFRLKMFCLIWLGLYLLSYLILVWIQIDANETKWNPFESYNYNINSDIYSFTTINFKSVQMGAITNLLIFTFKPILTTLIPKFRRKCKCLAKIALCRLCCGLSQLRSNTRPNSYNPNRHRSTSVYKKPYFQWTRSMSMHSFGENQAIQMTAIE